VLTVAQAQTGAPYRLRIDVDVVADAGAERHQVVLDGRSVRVELPAGTRPARVVVDPDTWLLADISVRHEQ
jgi:hypothetical protein